MGRPGKVPATAARQPTPTPTQAPPKSKKKKAARKAPSAADGARASKKGKKRAVESGDADEGGDGGASSAAFADFESEWRPVGFEGMELADMEGFIGLEELDGVDVEYIDQAGGREIRLKRVESRGKKRKAQSAPSDAQPKKKPRDEKSDNKPEAADTAENAPSGEEETADAPTTDSSEEAKADDSEDAAGTNEREKGLSKAELKRIAKTRKKREKQRQKRLARKMAKAGKDGGEAAASAEEGDKSAESVGDAADLEVEARGDEAADPAAEDESDVMQEGAVDDNGGDADTDVSAWEPFKLHPSLLVNIARLKFAAPTAIQAQTLPSAVLGKKDILGAAETGSGKTLAFGLPILDHVLRKCEGDDRKSGSRAGLIAVIMTPTRELAVQIRKHMADAAQGTFVRVAVIVGGLSADKQRRQLDERPHVIVATPGRLWELIEGGHPYVSDLSRLRFFVLDEADRMVQQGHFAELSAIIGRLPPVKGDRKELAKTDALRQTFVFSATLTLPPEKGRRRKVNQDGDESDKTLEALVEKLGLVKGDYKVVDISNKGAVAGGLTEAKITCVTEEKDFYLYYFLKRFPGRTLVFVNSIDAIRRLTGVFGRLDVPVLPLHASMQQRQRLKNLDRFRDNDRAVIFATDVAARGLDIPDIQHVIHYQIPRSADVYVHRSGRTARGAHAEGISIAIVGPEDAQNHRKICRALGKGDGLPTFPVELSYLPAIRKRVTLARKIDAEDHSVKKAQRKDDWFTRQAAEMDVILDEDFVGVGGSDSDDDKDAQSRKSAQKVAQMTQELKALLSESAVLPAGISPRYITSAPVPNLPSILHKSLRGDMSFGEGSAVDAMKTLKSAKRNWKRR